MQYLNADDLAGFLRKAHHLFAAGISWVEGVVEARRAVSFRIWRFGLWAVSFRVWRFGLYCHTIHAQGWRSEVNETRLFTPIPPYVGFSIVFCAFIWSVLQYSFLQSI